MKQERKMPGFTAEVSLYQTNAHYPMARTESRADGRIYPQQTRKDCLQGFGRCANMCDGLTSASDSPEFVAYCEDYCLEKYDTCIELLPRDLVAV